MSLARRREALTRRWDAVFEAERVRIGDAVGAWRHCLVGACSMLRELVDDWRRRRLRTAEHWKYEVRLSRTMLTPRRHLPPPSRLCPQTRDRCRDETNAKDAFLDDEIRAAGKI